MVGVPKTIDNDIDCTDVTFGFDTALTIATEAIDRLHSTAESHQRVMLVEVMGRHAGWIALHAGLASGAHMTLIPEVPFDVDEVCRLIKGRFQRGDSHFICVVAEGAKPAEGSMELRDGELTSLGISDSPGWRSSWGGDREAHQQRGAHHGAGACAAWRHPTPFDRVLATRFGVNAADAAHAGSSSDGSCAAKTSGGYHWRKRPVSSSWSPKTATRMPPRSSAEATLPAISAHNVSVRPLKPTY